MYFHKSSINHGLIRINCNNQCIVGNPWPVSHTIFWAYARLVMGFQWCNQWFITYNHGSSNDGLRAGQVDHFVCDTDFGNTVFASGDITKVPHVPLCILWGAVLFVEGVKVGSSTGTAYKEITKGQMPTRISVCTSLFNFFWKSRVNHVRQSSSVNFPQTNQILTNNQHNVL